MSYGINSSNFSIDLNIPKSEYFLHRCYIESARIFWKNPLLFSHEVSNIDKQRNAQDSIKIINDAIVETIRKLLPMETILKVFLGDDYIIPKIEDLSISQTDLQNDKKENFKNLIEKSTNFGLPNTLNNNLFSNSDEEYDFAEDKKNYNLSGGLANLLNNHNQENQDSDKEDDPTDYYRKYEPKEDDSIEELHREDEPREYEDKEDEPREYEDREDEDREDEPREDEPREDEPREDEDRNMKIEDRIEDREDETRENEDREYEDREDETRENEDREYEDREDEDREDDDREDNIEYLVREDDREDEDREDDKEDEDREDEPREDEDREDEPREDVTREDEDREYDREDDREDEPREDEDRGDHTLSQLEKKYEDDYIEHYGDQMNLIKIK